MAEKERLISNFLVVVVRHVRQIGRLETLSMFGKQQFIKHLTDNVITLLFNSHIITDLEMRSETHQLVQALCHCPFEAVRVPIAL